MKKKTDPDQAQTQDSSDERSRRGFLRTSVAALAAGVSGSLIATPESAGAANRPGRILIAYFTRTGTTREVAQQIQQRVGGDLFEMKTTHSYPQEYRATTDQAKREQQSHFRPRLAAEVRDIGAYEIVFLGYPNWWGTMPMACFSFLEKYRLAGKTVIPFCTHEGSRLGNSVADIRGLCPGARIAEGLALRGGGVENVQTKSARQDVAEWLGRVGLA